MARKKIDESEEEPFCKALSLRSHGDHAGAVIVLAMLLSKDANHEDALFLYGASLFSLDRSEEAADTFRKVLATCPKNEYASLGLFHSLWKLGAPREAFQEMRRFMTIVDSEEYERLLADIDAAFGVSDEG